MTTTSIKHQFLPTKDSRGAHMGGVHRPHATALLLCRSSSVKWSETFCAATRWCKTYGSSPKYLKTRSRRYFRIASRKCLTDGRVAGRTISVFMQPSPLRMCWGTINFCWESLLWRMRPRKIRRSSSTSLALSWKFLIAPWTTWKC